MTLRAFAVYYALYYRFLGILQKIPLKTRASYAVSGKLDK